MKLSAKYLEIKKEKMIELSEVGNDEVLKKIRISGKAEAMRLCKRNNIEKINF